MAYLKNIFAALESHFFVHIHGALVDSCPVDGIFFLPGDNKQTQELSPRYLYIGQYEDGFHIPSQGIILLLNCNDASPGKNVFFISESLSKEEVYNTAQLEIQNYHKIQLKKEELFNALRNNSGVSGIVNTAYTYIENPISICDASFSIIAACPPVSDDQNLEKRNGKYYLKPMYSKIMTSNRIIERIYRSLLPFAEKVEDFPYKWIFAGIRINRTIIGYVCVRGLKRPVTENDLEFIHTLSSMLSIEMQKSDIFSNPTGLKYEYFLTELLEGHFDNEEFVKQRLIQLDRRSYPWHHILVIRFYDTTTKPLSPKHYYDQILSIFPESMVVFFRGHLTILLGTGSKKPFTASQEKRFQTYLRLNQMYAAISFPFKNILHAHDYFKQIQTLLTLPGDPEDENRIIPYGQHFLEHLFSLCPDMENLQTMIHPDILTLLDYDKENHTEYAKTLKTYLQNNRNSLSSANQLHIHKSTFFYRLNKMQELFDIDINDGGLLFSYEFSFHVLND